MEIRDERGVAEASLGDQGLAWAVKRNFGGGLMGLA